MGHSQSGWSKAEACRHLHEPRPTAPFLTEVPRGGAGSQTVTCALSRVLQALSEPGAGLGLRWPGVLQEWGRLFFLAPEDYFCSSQWLLVGGWERCQVVFLELYIPLNGLYPFPTEHPEALSCLLLQLRREK